MNAKKTIFPTIFFAFLLFAYPVRAQGVIQTFGDIATLFYGVVAGLAALMIALHAVRWKTASGPSERQAAKKSIINVLLGLTIVMVSGYVVHMIYVNPNPPVNKKDVSIKCDMLDGWYTGKGSGPSCFGNESCPDMIEKVYRDYSLVGGNCLYTETDSRTECARALILCPAGQTCLNGLCIGGGIATDCNALDGWYTKKGLGPSCIGGRVCPDNVEMAFRDYKNDSGGCIYTENNTKIQCSAALTDCPAPKVCDKGLCVYKGTVRTTTTLADTTTSTTTTTIPPEKLLTAKNLVDCINKQNGRLESIEPVSGCAKCRLIKCKIFGKETDPPVGPGRPEYDRLTIKKVSAGPIWYKEDGTKLVSCRTMPEINEFFGCSLIPVPGHDYKECKEDPGIIEMDC